MKVVYIAGAYSAEHAYQIKLNIQTAEALGMSVAAVGAVPIIPHCNTAHWEGIQSDQWFYEATEELLSRCDAMVYVDGHEKISKGTAAEIARCEKDGIPYFSSTIEGFEAFHQWLNQK